MTYSWRGTPGRADKAAEFEREQEDRRIERAERAAAKKVAAKKIRDREAYQAKKESTA